MGHPGVAIFCGTEVAFWVCRYSLYMTGGFPALWHDTSASSLAPAFEAGEPAAHYRPPPLAARRAASGGGEMQGQTPPRPGRAGASEEAFVALILAGYSADG